MLDKPLTLAAVAVIWFAMVFVVSLQLTFPSELAAQRASWEVKERTAGAWSAELASVSPWWVGGSAQDVVFRLGSEPGEDGTPPPAILRADALSARVGLVSLLQRAPRLHAELDRGEGHLEAEVGTALDEGNVVVESVQLDATNLPIEDLLAALAALGTDLDVGLTGSLDVEADVETTDGIRGAEGKVKINGSDIELGSISAPSYGIVDLQLGVPVDDLQVKLKAREGTIEVSKGKLVSALAEVDVTGEITLSDRMEYSRLKLKVVVDLLDWEGTELSAFRTIAESGMKSAKWADGRYHYSISGTFARWDFRAERERETPSRTASIPRTTTPSAVPRTPSEGTVGSPVMRPSKTLRDRVRDVDEDDKPSTPDVLQIGGRPEPDDEADIDYEEGDDELELDQEDLERVLDKLSDEELEALFEEGALDEY